MKTAILKPKDENDKSVKKFDIIPMDMFWLSKEEKGGECVVMGMMSYLRITYPDGTKTQHWDKFNYE